MKDKKIIPVSQNVRIAYLTEAPIVQKNAARGQNTTDISTQSIGWRIPEYININIVQNNTIR